MEFSDKELASIEWCMTYFAKISNYGQVGGKEKKDIDEIIHKISNRHRHGINVVAEVKSYEIDMSAIRIDSVVQYKESGSEWKRGLVKHVDKDRVKVVRSFGINHSFSATQIGRGDVDLMVEIY